MSRSAGTGSPSWWACPNERSARNLDYALGRPSEGLSEFHRAVRTGRTKPYKTKRGSCIGTRSLHESHEYVCSCGKTGWTNHREILTRPIKENP